MTIQGAIAELQNLLEADDVPFYYKGGIEKVIETIQMEMADRKTEPSNSEKPNNCEPKICDTCRYYNSIIPCGTTPSACKEADKFAEEFVDGLKKLKQTVPTISKMEQVEDEPQTERSE